MSFDWDAVRESLPDLMAGLERTLLLSLVAAIAALVLGSCIAMVLASRHPVSRLLARGYVEFMRGIPSLILILIFFYVLPRWGLMLDGPSAGLAALSAYYAAYVAEVLRGALAAVPAGHAEAGLAMGLSRRQILARIVVPQALGPMLPPLAGLCIGLVKESALLSVISVHEFTFAAKETVSLTYAPFEIYATVALIYWAVSATIALAFRHIEGRNTQFRTASKASPQRRLFRKVAA